ncbi:unnamed protein product [Ceratitis capitata]|uniref:(Mediterranean fruit fly) hypothetical protein n=1 Tax=Ceratitis capitata TaxID=7213 RepID=A0A811UPB8_CERCA|nr:unnamed protein product [Ceratitis capitata]
MNVTEGNFNYYEGHDKSDGHSNDALKKLWSSNSITQMGSDDSYCSTEPPINMENLEFKVAKHHKVVFIGRYDLSAYSSSALITTEMN